MNFLFTGVLIALGYLFSKYLMALFITDPTVVVLGQQLLFIVLWAILFLVQVLFLHQSCGPAVQLPSQCC